MLFYASATTSASARPSAFSSKRLHSTWTPFTGKSFGGYGSLSSMSTCAFTGADAANAAPEGLVGIVRTHAIEQCRDVRPAVTRSGFEPKRGRRDVQLRQVPQHRLLALVLVRRHLDPPRLEHVAQVPALPPAYLERRRAARVEGASERRAGGIRNLTTRKIARDAPARIGLRDRPQQRLRVRVLRVLCRSLPKAPSRRCDRDTGWRCGRRRTSPSRDRA